MLKNQVAYLPDLNDRRSEANIDDAIVGEPGESDPEEEASGNPPETPDDFFGRRKRTSCPSPRRRVRPGGWGRKTHVHAVRRIPADLLSKVYELLKRLLETGLIEYSDSEWASAIVFVMKKNGTDARL
ncbi:hypothetical protein PHMEG_00022598 [Phytophthora megakarya]|uniref:Reverse transcriptase n=1 Tax=Phytophthora megakarya TaxID=4795 RepID=A0A225VIC2_9STRA|nr:hypothetical protein PHMEG_00022598 [Phytophthora megakarya]